MTHLKDILAINKPQGKLTFTEMSKRNVDDICRRFEEYATDIKFDMTDVAYDIIQRVFNSNIVDSRGLYVCGKPGVGKSYVFLALRRYELAFFHPCPVLNINVREFLEQYKTQGSEYFLQVAQYPRLALHNFGFEGILNDYGTRRDLIIELMDLRYDRFQQDLTQRTYITTNLKKDYVHDMGAVVSRRFKEMMNYFEVK